MYKECSISTSIKFFELFSIIIVNFFGSIETWAPDIEPNISLSKELKNVPRFFGNKTDYFKILDQDDESILIGASNHVYNLSLNGLRENNQIKWYSSDADRELCALKGKTEQDCQNYIRVFARISPQQIMICGTNSYKPRCRFYGIDMSHGTLSNNILEASSDTEISNDKIKFKLINEVEAQGRCPYNAQHNSTYIFSDGQLYSATVADFSGSDPLIYREPLRTEQYDLKQLNKPAFVSALERNAFVFYFFRENAMESMNCGKTIYSRVGRVCKNDKGGPYAFSDRWTSFLKARLNCSVPGEYPFYFDEIQSTSQIVDGLYSLIESSESITRNSLVYAVFTTSINAIPGSAVCAFSIDSILDVFNGRFKYQRDSTSNWMPLSDDKVPEPRPGQCVDDSRTLSSTSVNFVKTHSLMEESIPSFHGRPLITRVNLNYRLTAVTVDPQVLAIDNKTYDVIFVGTDNGKVIKFIYIVGPGPLEYQSVVIAIMDALPEKTPVRELTVSKEKQSLIVVGDGHIISLPLFYCSRITCRSCLMLQDPYCAWDISNLECKSIYEIRSNLNDITTPKSYIQTINSTENVKNICKHFDKGSEASGRSLNTLNEMNAGDINTLYFNYDRKEYNNNNNKIELTSINPEFIGNRNENEDIYSDEEKEVILQGEKLQYASSNPLWTIVIIIVIAVVFAIGLIIGWHSSGKFCNNTALHTEHRNQLNTQSSKPITYRNSGKDINLLMNTTNTQFSQQCNNKKYNIDHEFVNDKDRSHECKNSTENLEKEMPFSKTGTLTKVKRTYI